MVGCSAVPSNDPINHRMIQVGAVHRLSRYLLADVMCLAWYAAKLSRAAIAWKTMPASSAFLVDGPPSFILCLTMVDPLPP